MNPQNIQISEYDYPLDLAKIAQEPSRERIGSKLLVYKKGQISDSDFKLLPGLLKKGDTLIFNDTRVINARMLFRKHSGARIEIFCLEPHLPQDYQMSLSSTRSVIWKCYVGNLKKWKSGSVESEAGDIKLRASLLDRKDDVCFVQFEWDENMSFGEILSLHGAIPLPPYIKRGAEPDDKERYQTIYSEHKGSVAAPTAGLHFDENILEKISEIGINSLFLTLHVGAGTFKPVSSNEIGDHEMHDEVFGISVAFLKQVISQLPNRIICVGTTSLRAIESMYWLGCRILRGNGITQWHVGQWEPYEGDEHISPVQALNALLDKVKSVQSQFVWARTSIIIAPGYSLRVVSGLMTNFHLPKSTLLLLISAIIGEDWKKVYKHASENNYRFLSYGDSSLLWKS